MLFLAAICGFAPSVFGTLADKIRSQKRVFRLLLIVSIVLNIVVPYRPKTEMIGIPIVALTLPSMSFFRAGIFPLQDALIAGEAANIPNGDYSKIRLWASVGSIIAGFLMTWSMQTFGFGMDMPFYYYAVLGFVLLFYCKPLNDVKTNSASKVKITFAELKPMRLYGNFYVVTFTLAMIMFNLSQGALLYIQDMLIAVGGTANQVGTLMGIRSFMDAGVLFMVPLLRKKLTLPALIALGGLFYSVEMLSYPLCASPTQLMAVALCSGAGMGLLIGGGVNYMFSLAPEGLEASAMALYTATTAIAQVPVNIFAGLYLDLLGIRWFYTVLGTLVLITLVLFLLSFPFGKYVLKNKAPIPFGPLVRRTETLRKNDNRLA
jgi:MFS family permease